MDKPLALYYNNTLCWSWNLDPEHIRSILLQSLFSHSAKDCCFPTVPLSIMPRTCCLASPYCWSMSTTQCCHALCLQVVWLLLAGLFGRPVSIVLQCLCDREVQMCFVGCRWICAVTCNALSRRIRCCHKCLDILFCHQLYNKTIVILHTTTLNKN